MVTAQVLEATHNVDDRVRVVENKVLDVDNKMASVDDKVAGVDDRVAGVDDHVKAIDDKVAVVIDGAQSSLFSQHCNIINSDLPRRERDKGSHATSGRRHGSSET